MDVLLSGLMRMILELLDDFVWIDLVKFELAISLSLSCKSNGKALHV